MAAKQTTPAAVTRAGSPRGGTLATAAGEGAPGETGRDRQRGVRRPWCGGSGGERHGVQERVVPCPIAAAASIVAAAAQVPRDARGRRRRLGRRRGAGGEERQVSNPPNCHPPRERAAATAYRGGAMTMDGGRRRRASTAGGGIVPAAAAIPTPPPSPCRAREAAVTTVEAASLPASFRVTSPSTSKQLDGGPRRRSPVAEAPPQPSRRSRSWTAHTHEKRKVGSTHGKVSRYWTQTGSPPQSIP